MYYIVRHGQTEKNKEKTLQGRSNTALNEQGREQAFILRDYFMEQGITFDAVYSSPLDRAVETALLAAGSDVPVAIDERLIEMDYGPYEGTSLENMPEELVTFFSDFVHNPAPRGMESLEHVTRRMGEFLEDIHGSGDQNVLISVHAISMKGALEYLTPGSNGAYWSKYIANCGLYSFADDGDGFTVPEEIFYLPDAPQTLGV